MSSLATGKKISRKQLRKIIHTQMTAIKKQALHIKKQSELREENIDGLGVREGDGVGVWEKGKEAAHSCRN